MELARGRSWGGRKIQVQLSKYKQDKSFVPERNSQALSTEPGPTNLVWKGVLEPQTKKPFSPWKGGWVVKDGENLGVKFGF